MTYHDHHGKREFWLEYYEQDRLDFDWLLPFEPLSTLIFSTLTHFDSYRTAKVLDVGCGSSSVLTSLNELGWADLTGIDYNAVVIEKMTKKTEAVKDQIRFIQMDSLAMDFPEETFSHIIDKAHLDCKH